MKRTRRVGLAVKLDAFRDDVTRKRRRILKEEYAAKSQPQKQKSNV